jgi:hypothetical protein
VSRPRRGRFWSAVLLAVLAVVGGAVIAYRGYAETSGPDGVVRGYFAALARSDAPGALAFGDLPAGPRTLLTSTVLREQQRLAPLTGLQIVSVDERGSTARVGVRYRLGFASGTEDVAAFVATYRRSSHWYLVSAAVPTALRVRQAQERASIVGTAVPEAPTLLFPGAVPLAFDTPYLALDPRTASVGFGSAALTEVTVQLSAAGLAAVRDAVANDLGACVTSEVATDPRCPLPSDRYVPGSLHGTVALGDAVSAGLDGDPHGVIDVGGTAQFTGAYEVLDFDNIAVAKTVTLQLPLSATAYALSPIRIRWSAP